MLKAVLKSLLARTPYRLVRGHSMNRFQAIEQCLLNLAARGFAPGLVIDGGANAGDFARTAREVFASADIHLVEPQPACSPILEELARQPGFHFHGVALGAEPGELRLAVSAEGITTGAHVVPEGSAGQEIVTVPVRSIDSLFASGLTRERRPLLKLDLQGFEMEALKGSIASLPKIEVILTEASFFAQSYEPSIEDLVAFLHGHGFRLYDIASLSARSRDNRAKQADLIFVAGWSDLLRDTAWA